MVKKIIAWMLIIATTAAVTVGGTLAYLTDRDSEANVFTTGDVKIDLEEDFQQGAELIPGVDIEKKPSITNIGENTAWVWAEIAVPAELDNEDASKNVIHFNYSEESVGENQWNWQGSGDWMVRTEKIDGIDYNVYTVLYETPLNPGETTEYPVITKVYMDPHVDIDPDGNWHHVEAGVVTDLNWKVEENGNPVIYVSAYAMQVEGFDSCYAAYEAYQTQWGDKGDEYSEIPQMITCLEELIDAANKGGNYILGKDIYINDENVKYRSGQYITAVFKDMTLDLNGHTITIDTWRSDKTENAPVLFYIYSEGASLTVVGDGNIVAKQDAFIFFPRSVSEGLYIYGGNYYNIDDTSGTKNDINAIVYSQTNNNIHIYGGTFTFKNVSGHCGGFNVYDNSGAEIILHEGVLLSNSNYYKGSDGNEIHLAEGCTLQEVVIDGETWYQVVKQ